MPNLIDIPPTAPAPDPLPSWLLALVFVALMLGFVYAASAPEPREYRAPESLIDVPVPPAYREFVEVPR